MGKFKKSTMNKVMAALLAVILVGGVAQAVYIDAFNKTVHSATGLDETQQTYLKFSDRQDTTSKWVKRDYNLNGQTVDIWAQTVDGTFFNHSDDAVKSWNMTIVIEESCFINNAWTGTFEIHQFVGTDREVVQTLDLRNYDLADVKLTYLYDGDLLIPLEKGDYLVYHPSVKDELEIAPHGELTMGAIFYYLNDLNLSNYSIEYYYHRDLTHGISFIVLAALSVLLALLFAGTLVSDASYKRAVREMELRKSGLSSMSSIYSIISFIDLENDEIVPVYADEKVKGDPPEGAGARRKLLDIFARDTAEPYRANVLEFVDIDTLERRLEKESIALDYVSKAYGWSQVRFFAAEKEEGQPLKRVLFTIQDINDEKRELERFEQQSAQIELESSARSTFAASTSDRMRVPVKGIDDLSASIIKQSDDELIRGWAKQIKSKAKLLTYLIESAIETSRLDVDNVHIERSDYLFRSMVSDACDIAFTMLSDSKFAFEEEYSPSIPEHLVGDERRVKQVLIGLLSYAGSRFGVRAMKLSVYGTSHGDSYHLLFSVKTNGGELSEDEVSLLADFISSLEEGSRHGVDDPVKTLEGIAVLLALMESKLQVVNDPGEGCEFYFEIEQGIVDEPSSGDE